MKSQGLPFNAGQASPNIFLVFGISLSLRSTFTLLAGNSFFGQLLLTCRFSDFHFQKGCVLPLSQGQGGTSAAMVAGVKRGR